MPRVVNNVRHMLGIPRETSAQSESINVCSAQSVVLPSCDDLQAWYFGRCQPGTWSCPSRKKTPLPKSSRNVPAASAIASATAAAPPLRSQRTPWAYLLRVRTKTLSSYDESKIMPSQHVCSRALPLPVQQERRHRWIPPGRGAFPFWYRISASQSASLAGSGVEPVAVYTGVLLSVGHLGQHLPLLQMGRCRGCSL